MKLRPTNMQPSQFPTWRQRHWRCAWTPQGSQGRRHPWKENMTIGTSGICNWSSWEGKTLSASSWKICHKSECSFSSTSWEQPTTCWWEDPAPLACLQTHIIDNIHCLVLTSLGISCPTSGGDRACPLRWSGQWCRVGPASKERRSPRRLSPCSRPQELNCLWFDSGSRQLLHKHLELAKRLSSDRIYRSYSFWLSWFFPRAKYFTLLLLSRLLGPLQAPRKVQSHSRTVTWFPGRRTCPAISLPDLHRSTHSIQKSKQIFHFFCTKLIIFQSVSQISPHNMISKMWFISTTT